MLPNPMHPAVVHFPVVLMFLVPIVAIGAIWAIRRGANPIRAWAIPVGAAAALALSTFIAVETGEEQSERVERVVPDRPLDTHEESAELFLTLTGVLVVVSAIGFARGTVGRAARMVSTAGAAALIVAGARVGHSGGQLVYQYGAASAYANPASPSVSANDSGTRTTDRQIARRDRGDDDER